MKILAIDSSGLTATVALVEDDRTIAEYTVDYKKTHSQTLLPMISEMLEMVEMDIASVDAIAVSGGPGSFTGLRIGSATAKGLGFALNKNITVHRHSVPEKYNRTSVIVQPTDQITHRRCHLHLQNPESVFPHLIFFCP